MTYLAVAKKERSPLIDDEIVWDEAWGSDKLEQVNRRAVEFVRPRNAGRRINPKHCPSEGVLINKVTKMPAFWNSAYWFCNAEVKAKIEELEPQTHQFIPYKLWKTRGKKDFIDCFIINICNSIKSIDVDQSKILIKRGVDFADGDHNLILYAFDNEYKDSVYINPDVSDKHIWMDPQLGGNLPPPVFLSDELMNFLKDLNCRPVGFHQTLSIT